MKMFAFDVESARATFAEQGWVHLPGGLDPEYLAEVRRQVAAADAAAPLRAKGLRGEKDQHLLELAAGMTWDTDVFDVAAAVCGLRRPTTTLSERHIKSYLDDADPAPFAHKDRFASQISVGCTVEVREGSRLVLFPETDRGENPYLDARLRESLEPDRLPEVVLDGAPEVEIHDQPGDVVLFPGSSMWHLRRDAAGTRVVYVKLNDFDCDPLGEDPSTELRRRQTLEVVDDDSDTTFARRVPTLGRRFASVDHEHRRQGWPEFRVANVWGSRPFPVSDHEFTLLRALDGVSTVAELIERHGRATASSLRRLARFGAVDLLRAG